MYSDTGDTTSLVPGFPIRTSSDPRSVDSSPRHIAASHVLHRLLMPRHPPCALKHLQTQENNSTKKLKNQHFCLDARNHYPQIKHHTPPPRWSNNTTPQTSTGLGTTAGVVSGPNSVFGRKAVDSTTICCCAPDPHPLQVKGHPSNRPESGHPTHCGPA
jgi:hypothetical protein